MKGDHVLLFIILSDSRLPPTHLPIIHYFLSLMTEENHQSLPYSIYSESHQMTMAPHTSAPPSYPYVQDPEPQPDIHTQNFAHDQTMHQYGAVHPREDMYGPGLVDLPRQALRRYPESSQRTAMRDGSSPYGRDGREMRRFARDERVSYPSVREETTMSDVNRLSSQSLYGSSIPERTQSYSPPSAPSGQRSYNHRRDPRLANDTYNPSEPEAPYSNEVAHTASSAGYLARTGSPGSKTRYLSVDNYEAPFMLSSNTSEPSSYRYQANRTAVYEGPDVFVDQRPSVSSIPMSNTDSGWSRPSMSSSFGEHSVTVYAAPNERSHSPARTTPESEPPTSVDFPGLHPGLKVIRDAPPLPSTSTSSDPPAKKKKSKMHECEICGKKFPRCVLRSQLCKRQLTHNINDPMMQPKWFTNTYEYSQ